MPDARETRHIRFQRDGVCRSPACLKGGSVAAGSFGWWVAGTDIVWHSNCPEPKDILESLPEESEASQLARLDAWCDRKVEEEHDRFVAAKALREQTTGGRSNDRTGTALSGAAAGSDVPPADNEPTTHADVTSDPRYVEAF